MNQTLKVKKKTKKYWENTLNLFLNVKKAFLSKAQIPEAIKTNKFNYINKQTNKNK